MLVISQTYWGLLGTLVRGYLGALGRRSVLGRRNCTDVRIFLASLSFTPFWTAFFAFKALSFTFDGTAASFFFGSFVLTGFGTAALAGFGAAASFALAGGASFALAGGASLALAAGASLALGASLGLAASFSSKI